MRRPSMRVLCLGVLVGVALGLMYSMAIGIRPQYLPSSRRNVTRAIAAMLIRRGGRSAGGAPEVRSKSTTEVSDVTEASSDGARSTSDGSDSEGGSSFDITAGSKQEAAAGSTGDGAGDGGSHSADSTAIAEDAKGAAAGARGEAGVGAAIEAAAGAGDDAPLERVCGSPAVDGYAHVVPQCFVDSPTNKLWWKTHPNGGKSGEGLECNTEHAVSLDGLAVGWGIGNTKASPEECCQACRDHVPGPHVGGPFGNLPCNVWVFCNAPVCYEADAHKHSQGDCWLKFSEAPQSPEVNARGDFTADFAQRHPDAPPRCQWVSGVLLPPGQKLTNGTWGPRFHW